MVPSESMLFSIPTTHLMLRPVENRCYCGTTVAHDSIPVPDAWCTSTCSGDSRQECGGSNTLSLYKTDKFPTIGTA